MIFYIDFMMIYECLCKLSMVQSMAAKGFVWKICFICFMTFQLLVSKEDIIIIESHNSLVNWQYAVGQV